MDRLDGVGRLRSARQLLTNYNADGQRILLTCSCVEKKHIFLLRQKILCVQNSSTWIFFHLSLIKFLDYSQ